MTWHGAQRLFDIWAYKLRTKNNFSYGTELNIGKFWHKIFLFWKRTTFYKKVPPPEPWRPGVVAPLAPLGAMPLFNKYLIIHWNDWNNINVSQPLKQVRLIKKILIYQHLFIIMTNLHNLITSFLHLIVINY